MDLMDALEAAAYEAAKDRIENPIGVGSLWHGIIAKAERGALKAALELCNGNQTEAAMRLSMPRNTLRERVGRYNLRGYGLEISK